MTRLKPPSQRHQFFTMNFSCPDPEKHSKVLTYLARRGLERPVIERFQIGYSPAYIDEEYRGRALIHGFMDRFDADYQSFRLFQDACLVRLLNDKSARGFGYYRQQIDFTTPSPFARNYGDYFAGRIVFPIRNAETARSSVSSADGLTIAVFAGSSNRPVRVPSPRKAGSTASTRRIASSGITVR